MRPAHGNQPTFSDIVAVYDDDQGIGQYLRDLFAYVDFVSPMVYPSHWDEG